MRARIDIVLVVVVVGLLFVTSVSAQPPVSADGARVPPLSSVIDALGGSWTLAPGTGSRPVLRNGIDTEGRGSIILIWQGKAHVLGDGGVTWWRYTGSTNNGWENLGAVDPSTVRYPLFVPLTAPPGPADTPTAELQRQLEASLAETDALRARLDELQRRLKLLEDAAR